MARVSAEQWLRQIYRKDQKESEELFRLFSCREQEYTKERTSENASVSGAIFLILEMYSPFEGLMQVSSAPLRHALHAQTVG